MKRYGPYPSATKLPEVGERVIVIGTPLGLDKTVSDGIVSAVREIPGFGKIVQLTAPISPGSSGSPVMNMKGEVIGIATFFVVAGQNLNFAIPGERIARLTMGTGGNPFRARRRQERKTGLPRQKDSMPRDSIMSGQKITGRLFPILLRRSRETRSMPRPISRSDIVWPELGQYKEAIGPYQQAIRINPKDADFHNNLCVAYGMVGRYDDAIESCKQSIQLKSDLAESHNNLGWSYQRLGRYQEAIQSCKEAIRLRPDFALAHYNLGSSLRGSEKI